METPFGAQRGESAPRKDGRLRLEDGAQVAIIGSGPAGSFFAFFLMDLATRAGRDIQVDIYEPKDFTGTGPAGCNHCAGVVSESLVQNMAAEGINIPPTVMQRGIDSYVMHTDAGTKRIAAAREESRIAVVYRGGGPLTSEGSPRQSFDGFLLGLAREKGARVVHEAAHSLSMNGGRPEVTTRSGAVKTYDLLVGAVGLNPGPRQLFEGLGLGYRPPATAKAFICEFPLGREAVQKYLGNAMHVFLLNVPRLEFAAFVPKGDFVTACLLGDRIDKALVDSFLNAPEVKRRFPFDWSLSASACRCFPKVSVGGARRVFADRVVLIGDCAVTRLYKDGIRAAFVVAKAAAATAVLRGISAADFRRHYWPVCRRIRLDNRFGRLVFMLTGLIKTQHTVKRAILKMVHAEQRGLKLKPRMSSVLWDTFSGSARYMSIVLRGLHPLFLLRMGVTLLRAIFSPDMSDEVPREPKARTKTLGRAYEDGEVIVSEGEEGDTMYVVQSGVVEVVQNRDGRDVVLGQIGEADLFGEMSLLDREKRSATVRAVGEATVLTVDRNSLFSTIQEDPSLALKVLEKMSSRIRRLNGQLSRISATDRRNWAARPEAGGEGAALRRARQDGMKDQSHWDKRYEGRDLPWDTGRHDRELERTVDERRIPCGRALEVGCGTGSNAIWLARRGFRVTAVDISAVAISQAADRARQAGVQVDLAAADILKDPIPNAPFDFVFDRGAFHSLGSAEDRAACARIVHRMLADGGMWFSLMGNADGPERDIGPPQLSVREIAAAVEGSFEILGLRTVFFDSDNPDRPRAWACLMRRR